MKTIYILLFSVFASAIFTACKSDTKYNDTAVNLHSNYSVQLQNALSETQNNADSSIKMMAFEKINSVTDSSLKVMNGLQPNEEALQFHKALIDYYGYVQTEFMPILKKKVSINDTADIDAYNDLVNEYNAAIKNIQTLEEKAKTEQQLYAKKIGVQLR